MYYFSPTTNAFSNVKPDVSHSEAMFHNDVGSANKSLNILSLWTLSYEMSSYIRKCFIMGFSLLKQPPRSIYNMFEVGLESYN